jgi:uncharacterized MAPEG superfamily protein
MHYVNIVAALAILQFFFFGVLVGRARARYGVNAPATTGHELFEREFRVQMNTLEQLCAFLPALYLANLYWPAGYVALAGTVYLVGRFVYRYSYVVDPEKRGLGYLLTIAPTVALLGSILVGAVRGIAST